ncbi:uncharacterized protein ASCRUDRAFT_7732, partial [Ascoidea rubescens DSM 1968]
MKFSNYFAMACFALLGVNAAPVAGLTDSITKRDANAEANPWIRLRPNQPVRRDADADADADAEAWIRLRPNQP